ncbi:uncharacterized protein LOC134008871 isoform X2 [Osmerus eperlanus]|uniref:uncharacterized protein LOC134008871 isoform X2 n=1 Tax=Osmerus eperlanus TaxID=29151 RepID=UPI002E14D4C1
MLSQMSKQAFEWIQDQEGVWMSNRPPSRSFHSIYLIWPRLSVWSQLKRIQQTISGCTSEGRSKERDVWPSYFHRFQSHLHQRQASRGRSRVRSRKAWWSRRTAPSQVFDRRWGREERVSGVETSRENLLHQGLYAQTIAQKRCREADEEEEACPCFKRIRYGQTAVH